MPDVIKSVGHSGDAVPINRIKRMRDWGAVFRDFTWPRDLPDFGRYNLIYGYNWSGKTTLSRVFRALEAKTAPPDGELTVAVDGRDVSHDKFGEVMLPVRVFNRDFIAESVFPTGGEVAPIFVLGKESVEKQKQVEQVKADLAREQTKLGTERQSKSNAESALDKFCIDAAKVVKDTLRSAGTNPYNNYDKGDFRRRAREMITADDRQTYELSIDGREKLLTQIRSGPKPKLEPPTYRLPDLKSIEQTVTDLLSTTVVSAAIQSLKDDPKLSSWVHGGLGLHQERDAKMCLFCDQPMPKDRLAALEAHFSTEYEDLLRQVDDQSSTIQAAINAATDLLLPNTAQFYDELLSEYDSAAAAVRGERDSAKRVLGAFVKALDGKKSRPFERVVLDVAVPALNDGVVDHLSEVILKHNQACDDFQTRLDTGRMHLEADSVAGNLDEFVKLGDAVRAADAAVLTAAAEVKRLEDEIARLEREIVEHRQPAEELNEDLRNYLGHRELHLKIKETGYSIMRHDTLAVAPSEGEMTAIALLYFLKSLQDRSFDLSKGVVVLDDPVSSLDANALYFAFGYIRERTQNARQLIILTHNFTFFRQVRNWFRQFKGQKSGDIDKRPARFYMLNCTHGQTGRCAAIESLDPLLEEYDSEYHYMFARIYRAATANSETSLEHDYMLPNLARRLLEAFLAFRQPEPHGSLERKFDALEFDSAKKRRILRFLHTFSHGDGVIEPEHDLTRLSEANAVLKDLLEMMKALDAGHFNAMVALTLDRNSGGDVQPIVPRLPVHLA